MHTDEEAAMMRHLPDWGALILINLTSFCSVAALVLLSMAADKVLSNLF